MRLIDADELLVEVMGITDGWLKPPKNWKWYEDSIRNAPTVGGWVSVKDRLPEDGTFVAVRHKINNRIYTEVANYLMGLWWLDWDSNGSELDAIQWMSLPEPPEEAE